VSYTFGAGIDPTRRIAFDSTARCHRLALGPSTVPGLADVWVRATGLGF